MTLFDPHETGRGAYAGREWRIGYRRTPVQTNDGIVLVPGKVYTSELFARKAAALITKRDKLKGWEHIAVQVECRIMEIAE